jgi:phage terminase Nu1 subunit (DNA packaging protein)
MDKRDGVEQKTSIRERLRLAKPEAHQNQNEEQNSVEREII